MNHIIGLVGDYSIKMRLDPFLALIESIINQQLTGKAAQSIYDKFIKFYGTNCPSPSDVYSTSNNTMRSFGISKSKLEYIKNLAMDITIGNITIKGEFFLYLTNDEITEYLTKIKGVGPWTAEMFMIFCLGRLDVFPLKDLGIKKSLRKWYFPQSKDYPSEYQMLKISSKWKPFRTIATWYLWKSISNFDSIG